MLESPGALLRAWRSRRGWTQSDVAEILNVTTAAVSNWETGSRRIPVDALERLDAEYDAGGCLVDLVRAIGALHVFSSESARAVLPAPRRYWPHVFVHDTGPIWVWVRSTQSRLSGCVYAGPLGVRFCPPEPDLEQDSEPDPAPDPGPDTDGLFVTIPFWDRWWPLHVVLDEPGWVEFGRGVPPAWFEGPVRAARTAADTELLDPGHRQVEYFIDRVRERDLGPPETLSTRIRDLVGPTLWERLTSAPYDDLRAAQVSGGTDELGPPTEPDAQRRLHHLLREARSMSRADAAGAATALLAGTAHGVSEDQIYNYETGRGSRIRHLPAVLDFVYGGGGWSCFEPVTTRRVGPGLFAPELLDFWVGPITVHAQPVTTYPQAGTIVFETPWWRNDRPLEPDAPTFTYCRTGQGEPLTVSVPPGWAVQAYMGHDPAAVDTNRHWLPTEQHAEELFEEYLAGMMALIGKTKADLDRALGRQA